MKLPKRVHIMEVGPRDGFQAEHDWIPTEEKIEIVDALSRTGIPEIQATSFVHPKAVPQLRDAEEVMANIVRAPGVRYQALVPNMRGLQRAIPHKPDGVHLMMSVTESHNRSNGNRSIDESFKEFEQMVPAAQAAGIEVEAGMACVFGCPFEGVVPLAQLDKIITRYREMGIHRMSLGDTIGVANPRQMYDTCCHLLDKFPDVVFTMHLHNTRDMALATSVAAMQAGMTRFDGAVGGLGGCPYAPGATGNVATEDLVNMMTEMGIETGVDLDALITVSKRVREVVNHRLDSCMVTAGKRTDLKQAPTCQQKLG
ncbi:MAG TPA: hydroxymethylglutaryl-CoA lyase [Chloroflexota bacterium]|nr:hydroxymethylglutaryl-CoA lyase [Chloroflexota bacterium]